MFSFGSSSSKHRVAAIIDIGSGSVGVAIVAKDVATKQSSIVWSHREHTLLRTSTTLAEAERAVKTAFVNVSLELGNTGLRALHDLDPHATIGDIQISLAAPWQYTAAKLVTFSDDKPFLVDAELLRDLRAKAREQGEADAASSELLKEFGLTLIGQESIGTHINGYRVDDVLKKRVSILTFVHVSMLGIKSMIETIAETHEKILPKANLSMTTFIFMFYSVVMRMFPHTLEAAVIDVTKEATEVGIMRDGALRFVSHIPVGSFTLARAIAESLSIPTEEAFTYLKTNTDYGIASIPEKHRAIVNEVFAAYREKVAVLMQNTGDELSVPHSIFVHTDQHTELFFNNTFKQVAKEVTGSEHTIHPITSKLITESHSGDTAILLGIQHWLNRTDE